MIAKENKKEKKLLIIDISQMMHLEKLCNAKINRTNTKQRMLIMHKSKAFYRVNICNRSNTMRNHI